MRELENLSRKLVSRMVTKCGKGKQLEGCDDIVDRSYKLMRLAIEEAFVRVLQGTNEYGSRSPFCHLWLTLRNLARVKQLRSK